MSDTIWVAIITASSAIIPQIINKIIDYHKDLKLKKIEYYNQNKLDAIVDFLDSISIYTKDGLTSSEKKDFDKAVNKLLLYFPNIDDKVFSNIFESLSEWNTSERQKTIHPFIKKLSKSISEK